MEHKGKWKKRWIALGLSLMMILAGLPVEGLGAVTVYAEGTESGGTDNPDEVAALAEDEASAEPEGGNSDDEETPGDTEEPAKPEGIPQFWGIYIDEEGNLNPWIEEEGNDNNRYYKVVVSGDVVTSQDVTPEEAGAVPEDYSFYYNGNNHTLTLNSMQVENFGETIINSEYNGLTIELKGDSTLQVASGNTIWLNGNTTVTGDGTLTAETTCGRVVWIEGDGTDENPGHFQPATEENKDGFYPPAIEIGEKCSRFVIRENATIHAKAHEKGEAAIAAWNLAYGNTAGKNDNGGEITLGRLVNYGTVIGKVGLYDGILDGLISIKTTYDAPTDHPYIGKAYYFMKEDLYPNNMAAKLKDGDWRVVGKYDENGDPIPSKVFYQYIYKDCVGTVYTEDRYNPIQFLVYPEDAPDGKIDSLLTPDDVAAVDDGQKHVFNTDLYAVWFTNGDVTVNGNVTLDVACSSAPQEEWVEPDKLKESLDEWDKTHSIKDYPNGHFNEKDGAVCYVKDENGDVKFQDSSKSSVTINGSTGFLSLSDSYQGTVTVRDDINFCAAYAEREFLKDWIYRLQWQYDGGSYHPKETFYCAVPKAGEVVVNGQFTQKVKDLALEEGVKLAGQGLYEGTYFSQTETEMPTGVNDETETVAGTSAVINDSTLLVNVSKKNGLEENVYPLVRKASNDAVTAIRSKLSDIADMVAMDIAMIQKQYEKDVNDENDKQKLVGQTEVEPTATVNLYFDKLDLSKLTRPALYHIKDDGTIEKITFTQDADKKHIRCQTSSFSTYVFAEDQAISQTPSGGSTTDNSGGGAPSGGTGGNTTTETKPDGTKVETSTETKSDGTKVETSVETKPDGTRTENKVETKPDGTKVETSVETKSDGSKIETNAETKADGSKVENVVETAKDGSVKTTETVTKADGSATKTEKETETNAKGKEVAVTTTTKTDVSGKVTGITQTSEIEKIAGTASATVTVEKTADGKITSAEAEVDKKGANSKKGVTATLSGSVVSQITEAADTKSVGISMTVTAGKKEYTVKADAQDLEAGNKLKVMALDEKTGEYVLVNAKTYKVSESGNVKLALPTGMTYQLMDSKEAAVVEKQILATVKVKKSAATISEGKKTALKLSSKLNMDNVAKITYTSAQKSVATVNKNGTITAKNSGSVVIIAKVTLKNGKTKTVKMKIKVR